MKTKKDLKNEYKQAKAPMGVFQITNQSNGKILVEGSVNMTAKWNRHRTELRFGSHRNKALQADWNQFGETAFVFEVLGTVEYKEEGLVDYNKEVEELEELFLEELAPFGEKGYNKK